MVKTVNYIKADMLNLKMKIFFLPRDHMEADYKLWLLVDIQWILRKQFLLGILKLQNKFFVI